MTPEAIRKATLAENIPLLSDNSKKALLSESLRTTGLFKSITTDVILNPTIPRLYFQNVIMQSCNEAMPVIISHQ